MCCFGDQERGEYPNSSHVIIPYEIFNRYVYRSVCLSATLSVQSGLVVLQVWNSEVPFAYTLVTFIPPKLASRYGSPSKVMKKGMAIPAK